MKLLCKVSCFLLSIILVSGSVLPCFAMEHQEGEVTEVKTMSFSDTSAQIEFLSASNESSIYNIEILDGFVVSTHADGETTTIMRTNIETGDTNITMYEAGQLVKETQDSIELNHDNMNIAPLFAFPTSYVRIGSVSFNKNDAGVAYVVDIECKETQESRNERYNIAQHKTKAIQLLVNGLIAYFVPFNIFNAIGTAGAVADWLTEAGIISLRNDVIEYVTSEYIDGFISNYNVRCTNQYGASFESPGDAVYVLSGSRKNTVVFGGLYPQFLEKEDSSVASTVYFHFDGYGYRGVQTWNSRILVDYCTG